MTIVNTFVYIVTEALAKTFWLLTGNFGIHEEIRPKINMKNEFLYSRLLLTRNKKSYGGIILSELGRILKKPVTDIKGRYCSLKIFLIAGNSSELELLT